MLAFFTLLAFVAFMVGTPGPANLIVMLAGVRQGLRQCYRFYSRADCWQNCTKPIYWIWLWSCFGQGTGLANAVQLCQCWLYDLACAEIMASK